MNITKPHKNRIDVAVADRMTAIEIMEACPAGTVADLTDGARFQAVTPAPGTPPLWSGFSGPGCIGRVLTAGQVIARAQRLEGAA